MTLLLKKTFGGFRWKSDNQHTYEYKQEKVGLVRQRCLLLSIRCYKGQIFPFVRMYMVQYSRWRSVIWIILIMIGWWWTKNSHILTRDNFSPNLQHLIYHCKYLWETEVMTSTWFWEGTWTRGWRRPPTTARTSSSPTLHHWKKRIYYTQGSSGGGGVVNNKWSVGDTFHLIRYECF